MSGRLSTDRSLANGGAAAGAGVALQDSQPSQPRVVKRAAWLADAATVAGHDISMAQVWKRGAAAALRHEPVWKCGTVKGRTDTRSVQVPEGERPLCVVYVCLSLSLSLSLSVFHEFVAGPINLSRDVLCWLQCV